MTIDSRLKLISNSSLCSVHSCPRRYQLTKLYQLATRDATIHTEFGKSFGEGMQVLLSGGSLQDAVLSAIPLWTFDLEEEEKGKSFWHCITALEKFSLIIQTSALAEYEVATLNGKPACELSFSIALPDGFYYRGYVDIVMRHRFTGAYLVVDIKSTGSTYVNPAKYAHSTQALGYSVVMDHVAPGQSQYEVMYYEYSTTTGKFVDHVFMIGNLQRAIWIRDLLLDIQVMKLYDSYSEWPMHGESCLSYNRPCQFLDICTMSTASLCGTEKEERDGAEIDSRALADYDIVCSLQDLIESQLER
jgi:hypothetical protein